MQIRVTPLGHGAARGWLRAGSLVLPCGLGRSSIRRDKREGDGASPAGCFPLRRILYRPDRQAKPRSALPSQAITPEDGWCDAPHDPDYNRPVLLPHRASAERLWRADSLYDLIVVIGHNDDPPHPGSGSAIFLHLAARAEDGGPAPTEGCVSLFPEAMAALLDRLQPGDTLSLDPGPEG